MNPSAVRDNIKVLGDGYDYLFEQGEIEASCVTTGPESAFIAHFEVPPERRGNGIGSAILEAFLEKLRDDGCQYVEARIAVTETDSLDDPTVEFLRSYGFGSFEFGTHPDWGDVVRASRNL